MLARLKESGLQLRRSKVGLCLMNDQQTDQNPSQLVEAASKAFEQEFERFARFTSDPNSLTGLSLDEAIAEDRSLVELRTRHLGKKSVLAASKKLIGKVP